MRRFCGLCLLLHSCRQLLSNFIVCLCRSEKGNATENILQSKHLRGCVYRIWLGCRLVTVVGHASWMGHGRASANGGPLKTNLKPEAGEIQKLTSGCCGETMDTLPLLSSASRLLVLVAGSISGDDPHLTVHSLVGGSSIMPRVMARSGITRTKCCAKGPRTTACACSINYLPAINSDNTG